MYYNHNLRTNLQEWKNRLSRANHYQFGHQLKYFINNIENDNILNSITKELTLQFLYNDTKVQETLDSFLSRRKYSFISEGDQASYCISLLKYIIVKWPDSVLSLSILPGSNVDERKYNFIEQYISPLVNYLHDKLDKSNSTIYLLEKYKKRTEWFKKKELNNAYSSATKNYEQILEDDLRLFLFEQGIEYPFSTPKSTSGRADIIGSIDTSEPLIIEIKILDKAKGYNKKRIVEGFSQIVKYTNDYNKDFGYLVIFNLDPVEICFKFDDSDNYFPPLVCLNNKSYFFIVVNLNLNEAASKIGKSDVVEIFQSDLI